jgi:hypothetical protein
MLADYVLMSPINKTNQTIKISTARIEYRKYKSIGQTTIKIQPNHKEIIMIV